MQGYPLVLMSPLHFIARPTRWLEFMARHGTSHTVAPDFALGLATKCAPGKQDRVGGLATKVGLLPRLRRRLRRCPESALHHGLLSGCGAALHTSSQVKSCASLAPSC